MQVSSICVVPTCRGSWIFLYVVEAVALQFALDQMRDLDPVKTVRKRPVSSLFLFVKDCTGLHCNIALLP